MTRHTACVDYSATLIRQLMGLNQEVIIRDVKADHERDCITFTYEHPRLPDCAELAYPVSIEHGELVSLTGGMVYRTGIPWAPNEPQPARVIAKAELVPFAVWRELSAALGPAKAFRFCQEHKIMVDTSGPDEDIQLFDDLTFMEDYGPDLLERVTVPERNVYHALNEVGVSDDDAMSTANVEMLTDPLVYFPAAKVELIDPDEVGRNPLAAGVWDIAELAEADTVQRSMEQEGR